MAQYARPVTEQPDADLEALRMLASDHDLYVGDRRVCERLVARIEALESRERALREALVKIAHMTRLGAPISHERDINGIARAALAGDAP